MRYDGVLNNVILNICVLVNPNVCLCVLGRELLSFKISWLSIEHKCFFGLVFFNRVQEIRTRTHDIEPTQCVTMKKPLLKKRTSLVLCLPLFFGKQDTRLSRFGTRCVLSMFRYRMLLVYYSTVFISHHIHTYTQQPHFSGKR